MQYTMQDLIGEAKRRGFSPKPRMVQDWIELGLLDRPERHGLGRGKGVSATWPQQQLELFCSVLGHRRLVTRVAVLCNIPAWTWLYFGDSFVPLRQVRRALATWEGRTTDISWQTARQTARELFDTAGSPGRRKYADMLRDQVAEMLLRSPRKFDDNDEATLLRLLRQILDPQETGLVRTLGGMAFTPEAYVELLKARMRAIAALTDDRIDDSLFHWARYTELVSRSQYERHLASMTTAGAASGLTIATIDELVGRSCLTLVTLLGLGLGLPDDVVSPSLDHPTYWKANNLRSIVEGRPVGSGVQITVEVRPAEELKGATADQ